MATPVGTLAPRLVNLRFILQLESSRSALACPASAVPHPKPRLVTIIQTSSRLRSYFWLFGFYLKIEARKGYFMVHDRIVAEKMLLSNDLS